MIELMVAVLILTVGLLGLFQSVYAVIGHDMANQLRTEGVAYGDEVIAAEAGLPFSAVSTTVVNRGSTASRKIPTGFWVYSSFRTNQTVSSGSKNVQVQVSWKYKGNRYTHNLSTLVSQ